MSNDEGMTKSQLRGYWFSFSNSSLETTLLLKLCFSSSAMFVFLPSLALHVRLSPIGREDEMERRVNARAGRWTTLNNYHSKRGRLPSPWGEKVRMRAFYEKLECQFHF
jgi:hypothetical protein